MSRIAIVGAGIIGLTTAHALLDDAHEVVLIDKEAPGGGASRGNAGWVCPSQVAPLAAPGMLSHAAMLLLKRTSPLYISPRAAPQLARFLTAFTQRCNKRSYADAVGTLTRLAQSVEADYAWLEQTLEQHAHPLLRERHGVLACFADPRAGVHAHAAWRDRAGPQPGPMLDGDQTRALEPALGDIVRAGFELPADSHLDPDALTSALIAAAKSRGVTFVEQAGHCSLAQRNDRVVGVESQQAGRVEADEVVIAAGADSSSYLREVGIRMPVVSGYGYSFTVPNPTPTKRALHLEEAHVACTPAGADMRVAGTMELSGRMHGIDERRVAAIQRAARTYLPDLDWRNATTAWGAPRPVTPDGLPIIGRPRNVAGCVIATGHGMYGVTFAPTTAQLVARIISGDAGPEALSPSR